jgi:hypothetical protein
MDKRPSQRLLLALGLVFLASCGDGPSGPPVPRAVVVTPPQGTLTVTGETVRFSAQVLGKKEKVLTGIPIVWTSTSPDVAEVDEAGVAVAKSPGVTQVRATASGVIGQASLTVALEPAEVEVLAGDDQTGVVDTPLPEPLQLRVVDAAGAPIPGISVTFSVLQGGGTIFPSLAISGPDGDVNAQWTLGPDPGEPQRAGVSVGSLFTEFQASAVWPLPQVLTYSLFNGRATLGYSEDLKATGGNGVQYRWSLVGGALPAGMDLSTQGDLTGTPEEEGSFPFTVQVEDSEQETATRELTLRVCPPPNPLDPGEARVMPPNGGADACGFFIPAGDPGDRYRVAILRSETNRDPDDVLSVFLELRGIGVQPGPAPFPEPVQSPFRFVFPPSLQEAEEMARSTEAYHVRLREEERRLLATLPSGFRPLPSLPGETRALGAAPATVAPEKRQLKFATDGCADVMPRTAVLLGQNDHLAVYQDSLQSTTEPVSPAAVQTMLEYYRNYGKTVIDAYFGGVSDVNGDGQVTVYIAPGISDGVAGFVRSSDLLGRDLCPSSNEMEITYLKASFVNGYESGGFQLVGTLVHEIKHISSLYNRLVAGSFHPTWIEEGTAEIAADRASRLAMSAIGGPGMGDMLTLDDLVEFGTTVEGYNTRLRLIRTLYHLASQPNSVTVNPSGSTYESSAGPQERHTIYGAGWHFHWWLGDAYGGADSPFADTALFHAQNDSLTVAGPDAYPDLVGRSFADLMEEYAVAVLLNGTGAPPPPRAFTSVDFPSAISAPSVSSGATRPFGTYPWPVTMTEIGPGSVSLETASYSGHIGESGLRIHDFTSNGTGVGAEVTVFAPAGARVVLVRVK